MVWTRKHALNNLTGCSQRAPIAFLSLHSRPSIDLFLQSPMIRHPPPRSRYSDRSFVGGMMFIPCASRAAEQERLVISRLCGNEWVRGVCEKPRIKCFECPNRRFFPVTDEVIRWHLSGHDDRGRDFVMGLYAMLLDETCFFLAVDFDGEAWGDDAKAFLRKCQQLNLPAVVERSRSGNGGHVWFFFEEAVPASLARSSVRTF